MAWAFLSDPYYAVYCLMMLMVMVGYSLATIERRPADTRSVWWRMVLDLLLLSLAGLIAGIAIRGGGRLELFGLRLSMTRLYTPVLLLTVLLAFRMWLVVRLKFSWRGPLQFRYLRTAMVGAFACAVMLSPVLYAMATPQAGRPWRGPRILWRSSAPGVDLVSWLTPNPLHPLWGSGQDSWLSRLPNGFDENVASLSWIAVAVIVLVDAESRVPRPAWLVGIHGHLRVALSRAVRQRRRHQHLRAHALGRAPLSPDHRRRADADAHDHRRDARGVDAVRAWRSRTCAAGWHDHD